MTDESTWQPQPSGSSTPPPPPPPPSSPDLTQPTSPPVLPPPPPPPADGGVVDPSPPERRRGRGVLIAAVVAVIAVGGAGVFAATQFLGGDEGGAASPDELGEQVISAIDDADVIGMIDLLAPAERDLFRDPLTEIVSELRRLDLVGPPAGASGIEGVEIDVQRSSVRVHTTNVDDIVNLRLRGELTVTVDGRDLPVGDLVLDNIGDIDLRKLDTRESTSFDIPLTAIEIDDRWYLSMFFTIAEAARGEMFDAPDIPEVGITPRGGDSPEGAIDAMLDGLESLDLERIVAALHPGDAAALQRYAPLFLDDAQEVIDELDEFDFWWEITDTEYTVTGSGSTRSVSVDRLSLDGGVEGMPFSVDYVDGCARVSAEGETFDSCEAIDEEFSIEDAFADSPAAWELVELIEDIFADYEEPGIQVRQHDGEWYISPFGTVFDQILAVLRVFDRDDFDELIELIPAVIDEAFATFDGGFFTDDLDGGFFDDDDWFSDDDDWFSDDDDWFSDVDDGLDECFMARDVDDAVDCFADGLATGAFAPFEVPLEMRHPECGAAEAFWYGYASLADDEFIALISEGRPCFLDLVDTGVIDEFEVPLAFSPVECFEERNWFSVFDDAEYDDRFFECIGY